MSSFSPGGVCNYKTLIRLWNFTAYGEGRRSFWCALVMTAAKGGGEWKGETDACLRLNSLKEIKALKSVVFDILRLLWSDSAPTDFGRIKMFWPREAGRCRGPLIPAARTSYQRVRGWGEAKKLLQEAVYLIHPWLIRHGSTAFPDLVVFPTTKDWRNVQSDF